MIRSKMPEVCTCAMLKYIQYIEKHRKYRFAPKLDIQKYRSLNMTNF